MQQNIQFLLSKKSPFKLPGSAAHRECAPVLPGPGQTLPSPGRGGEAV